VNQVRLVLAALPPATAMQARVVLVNAGKPDAATRLNAGLLREFVEPERLLVIPWLGNKRRRR